MRILILLLSISLSLFAAEQKRGDFLGAKIVKETPSWFKTSFMDFVEDLEEATDDNKHVMIYFHQNGCPYCAKLVEENFHNPRLVAKLKTNFDTIEINMWGDKSLVDWEGNALSEKEFARKMRVQFTPTLIFLNASGKTVLRLNGYQNTEKMHKVLDFVSNKEYLTQSFATYLNRFHQATTSQLNQHSVFEKPPHILTRNNQFPAQKYLAVFFEKPNCKTCDNFHQNLMQLEQSKNLLQLMQVVQLNTLSDKKIITPLGKHTTAKAFYEDLNLTYTPAIVFFDKNGKEIIRKDALFKAYHLHGIMTYVLSGDYQHQPNFQRYLEEKSDKLRDQGITIDLWK